MAEGSLSFADPPREREASLFVFGIPLPIAFLPHIPLEACQEVPFPKDGARDEDCGFRSSLVCLAETVPNSPPNLVDRAWERISMET